MTYNFICNSDPLSQFDKSSRMPACSSRKSGTSNLRGNPLRERVSSRGRTSNAEEEMALESLCAWRDEK